MRLSCWSRLSRKRNSRTPVLLRSPSPRSTSRLSRPTVKGKKTDHVAQLVAGGSETAPEDCEVAVIGGGPAGLSAGLVLGRCLRRTLICDDGRYRNKASHALHCFLGQDGVVPL